MTWPWLTSFGDRIMPTRSPVAMSHPDRWIALLRIVVGLYFVKSLVTKMSVVFLGGVLPVPAV